MDVGYVNRDLKGSTFRCGSCGLTIDRQLNAATNPYLKMEEIDMPMHTYLRLRRVKPVH
jgi:transposase